MKNTQLCWGSISLNHLNSRFQSLRLRLLLARGFAVCPVKPLPPGGHLHPFPARRGFRGRRLGIVFQFLDLAHHVCQLLRHLLDFIHRTICKLLAVRHFDVDEFELFLPRKMQLVEDAYRDLQWLSWDLSCVVRLTKRYDANAPQPLMVRPAASSGRLDGAIALAPPQDALRQEGHTIRVRTTLDAAIQIAVEGVVAREASFLGDHANVSALVINNSDRSVLAYVGGSD